LANEPLYQNDKIGLRFLAPEGWSLSSRAELPSGALPKPIVLVAYQLTRGDNPAELEVLAADLAERSDLGPFLIEHRIGAAKWTLKPPAEEVTIHGAAGTRLVLIRKSAKGETRREVTAFQRGGRTFFFLITYSANDSAARDAARQSVESVSWQ
jgi:hypothetical protein